MFHIMTKNGDISYTNFLPQLFYIEFFALSGGRPVFLSLEYKINWKTTINIDRLPKKMGQRPPES